MSVEVHTVSQIDGSNFLRTDRVMLGLLEGVPNIAGSGAGASVTTAVAMSLPASYVVQVTTSQDATVYVTGKTVNGFNVVMEPRLAANTLAAGTFDALVIA